MADTIKITSRGQSMTAEVYTPAGEMTSSFVVIAYGSDGLTNDLNGPWVTMIREYADALVENGFTTIIPDYTGNVVTLFCKQCRRISTFNLARLSMSRKPKHQISYSRKQVLSIHHSQNG